MVVLMVLDAQVVVQCVLRIVSAGNVILNHHLNYDLLENMFICHVVLIFIGFHVFDFSSGI